MTLDPDKLNDPIPAGEGGLSLPVENPPEGSRWAKAHHVLLLFLVGVLVVWLLSGFYSINPGQVAVVERLGQYLSGPEGKVLLDEAGPHWALPWPIDVVHKIALQQSQTLEIPDFNASVQANDALKREYMRQGWPAEWVGAMFDPYLITADKNVLHAQMTVNYHITDPELYLTRAYANDAEKIDEQKGLLRQLAMHAMIRQFSVTPVEPPLTTGREALRQGIFVDLQGEADAMKLGVGIDKVDVTVVKPPDNVAQAFNDSLQARQDMDAYKQQAEGYANTRINEANGREHILISEAQAYKDKTVQLARGEADRFTQVYGRYKLSPTVTQFSLYSEALGAVMTNVDRVFQVQPHQPISILLQPPEQKLPGQNQDPNGGGGGGGFNQQGNPPPNVAPQ